MRHDHPHVGWRTRRDSPLHLRHRQHQMYHAAGFRAGRPWLRALRPGPAIHAEYEASRWPVFLPTLYRLWAGHPDPSQNVACDLSVQWQDGKIAYIHENGPVKI